VDKKKKLFFYHLDLAILNSYIILSSCSITRDRENFDWLCL